MSKAAPRRTPRPKLPVSIWALGFVSMFMDISSEMIHALLPVFLVTVLHSSTVLVGIIEGVGEATASFSKLFSGWLSDRLGNRKGLVILGYGLAAISKPLFALAPTSSWILAARISDRVGKGIRGAPRDALITDIVADGHRGAAFGLRQALDTVGGFAGPIIAIILMAVSNDNFRLVFWLAIIPALVSVTILALGVREPDTKNNKKDRATLRWRELHLLGGQYWRVVLVAAILTLARFSEAFLILRAQSLGLDLAWAPLVLIVMNVVYAAAAYPCGLLADQWSRLGLLIAGFLALVAADIVLAIAPTVIVAMIGIALWGLHMALTQGLLSALVADSAPANRRGTGFGLFHLVSGLSLLLASLIAGLLWDYIGPQATFLAGAAITIMGLVATIPLMLAGRAR